MLMVVMFMRVKAPVQWELRYSMSFLSVKLAVYVYLL